MRPERLLALFDRISEAPEAIPRLRQFILDLAIPAKSLSKNCCGKSKQLEPAHSIVAR